jgi:chemotaxis protein MotB
MSSRERHSDGEENINTSAWMVTFSDLIMLLLTFFVLLLTMSSLDQKAVKELIAHLKNSTGVLEFSGQGEMGALANFVKSFDSIKMSIMIDPDKLNQMCMPTFEAVKKLMKNRERIEEPMEISHNEGGVSLSFHENIFFNSGTKTISKESYPLLGLIADAIAESPNDILIMGHTDKTPVKKGSYQSNLELSAYRGLAVLEYFIEEKNLDGGRLAVGGYGSFRPLKPNGSRIGNPVNRRVEIIFKSTREI